jgi:hypothetical protein
VAFVAGLLLAMVGCGMLVLAASGAVVEGQAGAYLVSASFIAMAAPLLVLPFSTRTAKVVAFVVLGGFALAMLWAAFGATTTTPSLGFQIAAVVFVLLLLFRCSMALRKTPGVGT